MLLRFLTVCLAAIAVLTNSASCDTRIHHPRNTGYDLHKTINDGMYRLCDNIILELLVLIESYSLPTAYQFSFTVYEGSAPPSNMVLSPSLDLPFSTLSPPSVIVPFSTLSPPSVPF